MSDFLPQLPNLNQLTAFRPRPQQPYQLTPEERESLLARIGNKALGGVSYIGGSLDKIRRPVAAGLDMLIGGDAPVSELLSWMPFSDTLGITEQENAVSGRDLLEQAGVLDQNQTGFDGGDVAGFAADIAMDPLTYLTLGGSAVSRAGKIAKGVGAMDDAGRLTARSAVAGTGRKRVDKLTHTLRDVLGDNPALNQTAAEFAERQGIDLAGQLDQPLGGLLGVGAPWIPGLSRGEAAATIGTGPLAQNIAGRLDSVGEALRYGAIPGTAFSPGRSLAAMFDSDVQGLQTTVGQRAAKRAAQLKELRREEARGNIARLAGERQQLGLMTDEGGDALRAAVEQTDPSLVPGELQPLVGRIRGMLDAMPNEARALGVNLHALEDDFSQYFPRFSSAGSSTGPTGARMFSAADPSNISRDELFTNFPGGTVALKDTFRALAPVIAGGEHNVDNLTQLLLQRGVDPDRAAGLARFARDRAPEDLAMGVFGNDPLFDLQSRAVNFANAAENARMAADVLASPGALLRVDAMLPGHVRLGDVARDMSVSLGDEAGGLLRQVAERLGLPTDDLSALRRAQVPEDIAADLMRVNRPITPQPTNPILGAIDSATNLFKGGVTSPWPAFTMRNLTSGAIRNVEAGAASARGYRAANSLLQGRTAEGLTDIPIVQRIATQRGLPLDDNTASDIVRELAYQYELVGRQQGQHLPNAGVAADGRSAADLAASFPGGLGGGDPALSLRRVGSKYAMRHRDATINPLDMRGVGGRETTSFGPALAGEELNAYGEGINRLSPFIEQLRQGVDPAVAKGRVMEAQVDYSPRKYTRFERDILGRLIPFFKFSKGNAPFVARQLAQRPGGSPTGMMFEAMAGAHANPDAMLPEHITNSAAIPLGESANGDPRYLTSLGLMSEDPTAFMGDGLRGAGLELLSRLNPLLKGPAEYLTGQSFFQRGPHGGRSLDDMDPVVGRLLTNLTSDDPDARPVELPLLLETLASNSPLSRLLTTARKLSDPRKAISEDSRIPGLASLLPLLSGANITDVSPRQQDALLFDALKDSLASAPGSRVFDRVYVPQEALDAMPPDERGAIEQYQALTRELQRRANERRASKDDKKKKPGMRTGRDGLPALPSIR